jgi:DNA modification methylase
LNNENKDLKKKFRKIMEKNIYLNEKNELYKIDKLMRKKISVSFFDKINREKIKIKTTLLCH